MSDEIVVDVSCVKHAYPGGGRVDLCGLEFVVKRGQRVVVLGPNGSGKSTLLKHVLGILQPTEGRITVFGQDPSRHYEQIRPKIGALMQNADEQMLGPTVFDDVAFAPLNFGYSREETTQRVEAILHALNIYELRDRLPHYLSGGEKKKVALAGVLVFSPELLVMDEPLAGIDYASRVEILDFLRRLHRDTGMTMISTMHDMEQVAELADVGYVMRAGGRLELYGTVTELFFQHDLSDYNLFPPTVVQVIKTLQQHGYPLEETLETATFSRQLLGLLEDRQPPKP